MAGSAPRAVMGAEVTAMRAAIRSARILLGILDFFFKNFSPLVFFFQLWKRFMGGERLYGMVFPSLWVQKKHFHRSALHLLLICFMRWRPTKRTLVSNKSFHLFHSNLHQFYCRSPNIHLTEWLYAQANLSIHSLHLLEIWGLTQYFL